MRSSVVLGMCVSNVYNFSFLIEVAPKTYKKGRKGKRSKKDLQPETETPSDSDIDPSKGGGMVMVRLP